MAKIKVINGERVFINGAEIPDVIEVKAVSSVNSCDKVQITLYADAVQFSNERIPAPLRGQRPIVKDPVISPNIKVEFSGSIDPPETQSKDWLLDAMIKAHHDLMKKAGGTKNEA